MFGGVDIDEDDLFATSKKKVPPPTAPKSPASTTPKEAPKSEVSVCVFPYYLLCIKVAELITNCLALPKAVDSVHTVNA